jgi:hypothetical protein
VETDFVTSFVWLRNAECCLELNHHLISSTDENNFDLDSVRNIRHLQVKMCQIYKYQWLHVFLSIVSSLGVLFKTRLKLNLITNLTAWNRTGNTAINSHSQVTIVLDRTV